MLIIVYIFVKKKVLPFSEEEKMDNEAWCR